MVVLAWNISCRRGNSCWDEQWSATMRSELGSSQPQQPVKFHSFRSCNRLMNSDATGGRDLVSFQCKTEQRLQKWALSKWPFIPSYVSVKDWENYINVELYIYTSTDLIIVRDGPDIEPARRDGVKMQNRRGRCPPTCRWHIILKWIINKWGVRRKAGFA